MRSCEWAKTHAIDLLGNLPDRLAHSAAVAALAEGVEAILPSTERDLLVAAAWLHDIGYSPELSATGFHPLDGALHLDAMGELRLAGLVAYHSGSSCEGALRGLADEIAAFVNERSDVTAALAFCDLTRGPRGERMTPEERRADVVARYGPESPVSKGLDEAWPELIAAVQLVERRLTEVGALQVDQPR